MIDTSRQTVECMQLPRLLFWLGIDGPLAPWPGFQQRGACLFNVLHHYGAGIRKLPG